MSGNVSNLSERQKQYILELYKSHHTAREVSQIIGYSYVTINNVYKGFKIANVTKYDRIDLIPKETLDGINEPSSTLSAA